MASTGDVELRSHGYQVLRKRWDQSTAETIKLIKSSEIMNPCSMSDVYKCMKDSGMVKINLFSVAFDPILFDTFSKNVDQT